MATFYDHFSGHAELYRRYRPSYPPELYEWLAAQVEGHERAWDCGTGSGQAAIGLADRFASVIATDASPQQLSAALPHPSVLYVLASAEACPMADGTADLVTVAQALHWLRFDAFYAEVRRVARPGALFAAWSYSLFSIDPEVDAVMDPFYHGLLDPHWPPQRAHVRDHYSRLPFPFAEVAAPEIHMRPRWTREDVLRQVSTWSAVRRHDASTGRDAVAIEWGRGRAGSVDRSPTSAHDTDGWRATT